MPLEYWKKNPLQNGCKRERCVWWNVEFELCDYQDRHNHSRTSLHLSEPGVDINNPCREFEPRMEDNQ